MAERAAAAREAGTCTTARKGNGAYKVSNGFPGTARSPDCTSVSSTQPSYGAVTCVKPCAIAAWRWPAPAWSRPASAALYAGFGRVERGLAHEALGLQVARALVLRLRIAQFRLGLRGLCAAALQARAGLAVVHGREHLPGADGVTRLDQKRGDPPAGLRGDGALLDRLDHAVERQPDGNVTQCNAGHRHVHGRARMRGAGKECQPQGGRAGGAYHGSWTKEVHGLDWVGRAWRCILPPVYRHCP